ncbi:MAG: carbamoyltransferase C-terminal domain-containing protein [Planctomycetota bacterium]
MRSSTGSWQALEGGKVCGWFRGRFEWGPRPGGPLDHRRSAPVGDEGEARRSSSARPSAPSRPSVLEERGRVLRIPDAGLLLQRASCSTWPRSREEKRDVLPAITHEDGSGRLQTVYKDTNPAYHAMIEAFGRRTRRPVVIDTSFNLKGEPIVESPAHAFNTFSLSGMDLLLLGNYVIRPEAKKQIAETKFHLRHEGDSVTQMVS